MIGSISGPSASGARIGGDDLQHLIVWYWCLKTLVTQSDVAGVSVEATNAGAVDDVVVRYEDGHRSFFQVKAAVNATGIANVEWLCDVPKRSSNSILQRLHKSWVDLGKPLDGIALITSRPIGGDDEVFAGLNRRNRLGDHLRRSTKSNITNVREEIAVHLRCTTDEVCIFFDALAIHVGQTEAEWRDKVADISAGAGIKHDDVARFAALGEIREWVKQTRDEKDRTFVEETVERLGLRVEASRTVVTIQALVEEPVQNDELVFVNWMPLLRGSSADTRRGAVDPADWDGRMSSDLSDIANKLRSQRVDRVLVRGSMRLPGWFATGANLREVAGFNVALRNRGATWVADSMGTPEPPIGVIADNSTDTEGNDVMLTLALSAASTPDVDVLAEVIETVGRVVTLTVGNGPDRNLFSGAADTLAASLAIRNWVRKNLMSASNIHLVIIGSAPFAFFLGHLWDRVPPTRIYEDLAPGYEAAFSIRS